MLLKLITASLLILPTAFGQTALTAAQIAKKVSPSVVVIQGKTDSGEVLGSGFIVSNDGKIVTNLHVIREMKTASVQLANGEMFDSLSVLAIDERRDLAVVQIPGFNLSALEVGDSDVLTVGEPLVIVGSPRGLEGTVTAGILSSVRDSGQGFKVLQTDAAVNPGNSGGPLINKKGQAIGVVSFKMRSAEGLNFAVPINYVLALINNLHGPPPRETGGQAATGAGMMRDAQEVTGWQAELGVRSVAARRRLEPGSDGEHTAGTDQQTYSNRVVGSVGHADTPADLKSDGDPACPRTGKDSPQRSPRQRC